MIWEEAEARNELEERFWANLRTSNLTFCLKPRKCAETGKLLWLRKAVKAVSNYGLDYGQAGFEYECTVTKWFDPKAFTMLKLQK